MAYRIGPARILAADSINDPVEEWTDLGVTRGDVQVPLTVRLAMGTADQTGATPRADALYRVGAVSEAVAPMLDHALAILRDHLPGSSIVTGGGKTSLGLGTGYAAVVPRAFAIVPVDEYTEGSAWWDSEFTVWIPEGVAVIEGEIKAGHLPDEGDDALSGSVYSVRIQTAESLLGLPSQIRVGGIGPIWLFGAGVLGAEIVFESEHDTLDSPLIGDLGSFSRSGTATRRNAALQVEGVATGIVRDGHYERDPVSGQHVPSLLLESQRTNGWSYSQELDNAAWSKVGATITQNAATAPDGTLTADKVVEDASVASRHGIVRACPAMTDNASQAVAIFARAAERSWLQISTKNKAGSFRESWVNLATGVAGTVHAEHTVRVRAWVDGWYRIELVFNSGAGATVADVGFYGATADNTPTHTGDGASGIYLWGLQFEANAPFSSSYIPTTTGSATRLADVPYLDFPHAPEAMTLYARFVERGSIAAASVRVLQIGAGDDSNPKLVLSRTPAGSAFYQGFLGTSGGTSTSTLAVAPALGDLVELRLVLSSNGDVTLHQTINGGAEVSAGIGAGAAIPSAWSDTRLWLNCVGTNLFGFNAFTHLAVARGERSLAEMRTLSRGS